MASNSFPVACPIGTCQGLPSPNSPRMPTTARNGKRQFFNSEKVLMQLPTPLLCISSAARSPPSQAPAAMPMPSSSVASGIERISLSSVHISIRRA